MTAETLRRAASLMRDRAEGAAQGVWDEVAVRDVDGRTFNAVEADGRLVCEIPRTPQGSADSWHVASWHPSVALAVADWLEAADVAHERAFEEHWLNTARAWDKNNDVPMTSEVHAHFRMAAAEFADGQCRPALAVARAYLGDDQ